MFNGNTIEVIVENLHKIIELLLLSFLLFLYGNSWHALRDMFSLSEKNWQKSLTRFIAALLGAIALSGFIVLELTL